MGVAGPLSQPGAERRRRVLEVALLFGFALALRLWGLSYGLPNMFSGDEVAKRDVALHLAETGFAYPDPQPAFMYNSLFLIYKAARWMTPHLTVVDYHYLGRLWMAVLGSLTVVAVWRLASQLTGETENRTGLVAAALLAVLPLHTAASRYIKEDAPLALMVTLTVLAAVTYWQAPSRKRLLLVGLLLGMTCSTKFTGAVLLAPLLLASLVPGWRAKAGARAMALNLALLGIAALVGFLAISPIYLVHPGQLLDAVTYQAAYSVSGHDGIAVDPWKEWWTYYIRTGLIPGMTWPVFALAVGGLVLLLRARGGWLVGAVALVLYLTLEQSPAKPAPFSARYLMPVVPLLCVAAGAALVAVATALRRRLPPPIVYTACTMAFVAPPLVKSLMIADEAVHDTRLIAGKWMEANIPGDATIVVTEDLLNLPATEYWRTRWRVDNRDGTVPLEASWNGAAPPYFVISSFKFQRFLESPSSVPDRTAFYKTVMTNFELIKEFRPRWLTYGKHSPVIRIYKPPGLGS